MLDCVPITTLSIGYSPFIRVLKYLKPTLVIIPLNHNIENGIARQVLQDVNSYPLYLNIRVDSLKKPFIDRLATAVSIPSVSADASYRPKVHEMGDWLAKELEALGVTYILLLLH